MRTIKWETLKLKAIQAKCLSKDQVTQARFIHGDENTHFYLSLLAAVGESKKPLVVLEEWMQECQRIIENWDIRAAKRLIDLCNIKLKGYTTNSTLTASYNEKGEWVLSW